MDATCLSQSKRRKMFIYIYSAFVFYARKCESEKTRKSTDNYFKVPDLISNDEFDQPHKFFYRGR